MEENTTLILEGGAMRGLFTSGVLDVFMENDLYFPQVAGVSAGALNGVNYVSHQPGRSRAVNLDYVNDPRYMGASHLIKDFSYFNFDFLLGEVSETLNPLDFDTLYSSPRSCGRWPPTAAPAARCSLRRTSPASISWTRCAPPPACP